MDVAYCFTVTTHCAVRLLPSSVLTVIMAVPVETGITNPSEETTATSVLLELQETDLSVVLFGRIVAVSCKEFPIYKVAEVWLSEIDVANCLTATEQEALKLLPSAVFTVIVAFPTDTAVTNPDEETVAMPGLLEVQIIDLLDVVLGNTVAYSFNVFPVYNVTSVSLSVMDVASCLTVTTHCAVKLLPSSVLTVIVAVPVETGVTKPSGETVATLLLLELQETDLSEVLYGRTVAESCKEFPIYKVAEVWLSEMEVAGYGCISSRYCSY